MKSNEKTLIGEITEQTEFLTDPPVLDQDSVEEDGETKSFKGTGVRCTIQETSPE